MSLALRFREWLEGRKRGGAEPRIFVFGDSHTVALSQALAFGARAELYSAIKVLRVRKEKVGREIGDISLEQFCDRISRLSENDFVFSAIGGNQYAVVSTIRHEHDFLVLNPGENIPMQALDRELIPHRAFKSFIRSGVWNSDGPVLRKIRTSTKASVVHLSPPPPKFENDFIRKFHESRFAAAGLGVLEPTAPELRLAAWRMQRECLEELCRDAQVGFLPPPEVTVTAEGYLDRHYYSKDVTHGNRRYGEQVMRQILAFVDEQSGLRGEAA